MDNTKRKGGSRLPRINKQISSNLLRSMSRSSCKVTNSSEDSGTASLNAGMQSNNMQVQTDTNFRKPKSSRIPRSTRVLFREVFDSGQEAQQLTSNQYIPIGRNIQRVQLLINTDLFPEEKQETKSVASTRPIPKLRHIYGHLNIIDSSGYDGWLMELDSPTTVFLVDSNNTTLDNENSNNYNSTTSSDFSEITSVEQTTSQTTGIMQNPVDFAAKSGSEGTSQIVSDIEFENKDNESGYQSIPSDQNEGESSITSDENDRSLSLYDKELLKTVNLDNNKLNSSIRSISRKLINGIDPNFEDDKLEIPVPIKEDLENFMFLNNNECNRAKRLINNNLEMSEVTKNKNTIRSLSLDNYSIKKLITANDKGMTTRSLNIRERKKSIVSSSRYEKTIKPKTAKSNKSINSYKNDISNAIGPNDTRIQSTCLYAKEFKDLRASKQNDPYGSSISNPNESNTYFNSNIGESKLSSNNDCVPQCSGNKRAKNYSTSGIKKSGTSRDYCNTCTRSKQSVPKHGKRCSSDIIFMISNQSTVVICKSPEKIEHKPKLSNTDVAVKSTDDTTPEVRVYDSHVIQDTIPDHDGVAVPSYTECLSEILQRTTNFEAMEGTLDAQEELGAYNHSNLQQPEQTSSDSLNLGVSTSVPWTRCSDSSMTCRPDLDNTTCYRQSRARDRYSDHRRNSKYKKFPSNRFKGHRIVRHKRWYGPSCRRISRRRWQYMCKTNQPSWTHWSTWPPALSKKYFFTHFLRHSIIWEDADAQTNYHCQEAGTDNQLREFKSTANSVIESLQSIEPNSRDQRLTKDLGVPMFPFLYNSTIPLTAIPINTLNSTPEDTSCFESPIKMSKEASDNGLWNASHGINILQEEKCCQYEETLPGKPESVERETSYSKPEILRKNPTKVEIITSFVQFLDVKTSDDCSEIHFVKPTNVERATTLMRPVDTGTSGLDPELGLGKTTNVEKATSFIRFVDVQTSEILPVKPIRVEKATSLIRLMNEETSGNYSEVRTLNPEKVERTTSLIQLVNVATSGQFSVTAPVDAVSVQTKTSITGFVDNETSGGYSEVLVACVETGTSASKLLDGHIFQTSSENPLEEEVFIPPVEEDMNTSSKAFLFKDPSKDKQRSEFIELENSNETDELFAKSHSQEEPPPSMKHNDLNTSSNHSEIMNNAPSTERKTSIIQTIDYVTSSEKGPGDERPLDTTSSRCSRCKCTNSCTGTPKKLRFLSNSNHVEKLSSGHTNIKQVTSRLQRFTSVMRSVYIQTSDEGLDTISFNYAATNTPKEMIQRMKTRNMGTEIDNNATQWSMLPSSKLASKPKSRKADNITYYKLYIKEENGTQKSGQCTSGYTVAVTTPSLSSKVEKRSAYIQSEKKENGCQTITEELCYFKGAVSVQTVEQRNIPIGDTRALISVLTPLAVKEQKKIIPDVNKTTRLKVTDPNITSISSSAVTETFTPDRIIITEQRSVFTSTTIFGAREQSVNVHDDDISTASKHVSTMEPNTNEKHERNIMITCAISTSVTNLDSGTKDAVNTFTKSTSVSGLNTISEAEILLSNLIKKALIDVDTQASRFMELRESIKTSSKFATKSTYTCIELDSKSIFVNSPKITKLCIDTCVQSEEPADKVFDSTIKEEKPVAATCPKTVSCMTVHFGQTEYVQTTSDQEKSMGKGGENSSCVNPSSRDCETNTETLSELPSPKQPPISQEQKGVEVSNNPFTNSLTSKSQLKSSINNQLISLSRLIGTRRKTSSLIDTYAPTAVLSSNLDADKWMRACTSRDKDAYAYQSYIKPEKEFQSSPLPAKSSSAIFNFLREKSSTAPSETKNLLLNDSLADVLLAQKRNQHKEKHQEPLPKRQTVMVDAMTSDQVLTKNNHEFEHQAVPTVNDASIGTNSEPILQHKSASVLTSKCILPTCTTCNYVLNAGKTLLTPCKFVYGEPTCVIHRQSSNVEVQTTGSPQVGVVQVETVVERSDVGVLTPFFGMLPVTDQFSKRKSSHIGTILSPKVNKHTTQQALCDPTRMIVDEVPVRDTPADPPAIDRNTKPYFGPPSSITSYSGNNTEHTTNSKKSTNHTTAQTSSNLFRTPMYNIPLEQKATGDFIKIYKRDSRKKGIQHNSSQNTYVNIKLIEVNDSIIKDLQQQNIQTNFSQEKKPQNNDDKQNYNVERGFKSVPNREDNKAAQEYTEKQHLQRDNQDHDKLLEGSSEKEGEVDQCEKANLVTSCRYYSTLLSKQLGKVKDNLTKHLTISPEASEVYINRDPRVSICTMKPSGRADLACQTVKRTVEPNGKSHLLSPATCLTDICKNDKDHLKSVYTILSAIEGRMRRFNIDSPRSLSHDRWL